MSLNVAYYSDSLTTERQYGLSRYAWELLRELRKLAPEFHVRPVSAHVCVNEARVEEMRRTLGYVRLPRGRRPTALLWSSLGAPALENWTPWADVVHSVEPSYPVATQKPLVVTVHDLGPITHPHYFRSSRPWLLKRALAVAANRAATIICVSQTTANALEAYLRRDLGDRVRVVAEGVAEEFFEPQLADAGPVTPGGEPYFLWSGSFSPRKNVVRVVEAFEQIATQLPHHLVLCGGAGWDAEEILARIRASRFAQRIHLPGRVDDAKLRALYAGADAYVFVSLMEGFGLPVLEAMASGCPVITSNLSSMPEVAGNAAWLVDPLDIGAIAHAMSELGSNPERRRALAALGRRRAEQFRWSACAQSVAAIYRDAQARRIPAARRPASMRASPPGVSGALQPTVALYQPYPHSLAGLQSIVLQIGRGLGKHGWTPLIICPEEGKFARVAREAELPVLISGPGPSWEVYGRGDKTLSYLFSPRRAWDLARYWVRLGRELREREIALLHCNDYRAVMLAAPAARLAGIPVIWHMHGLISSRLANLTAAALVHRVAAVSRGMLECGHWPAWLARKFCVIHNGLEELPPETAAQPASAPVILAVGTLHPRKGYETLIRAFGGIIAQFPEAQCHILGAEFGDGAYARELRELAARCGVADQVHFRGYCDSVPAEMARCAVLAVPSRVEAFGMVALEAMAASKPVVAARTGGLQDIVVPGETGFLVENEDAKAMGDCLASLLSDPALAEAMGRSGRQRVAREFTSSRMLGAFSRLYRALTEKAHAIPWELQVPLDENT